MRATSRNNIIAGTFLVVALVLGVIVSIVLSDADKRIRITRSYSVRFPLAIGAHGLKSGSLVLLGGQAVGWVTGVSIVTGDAGTPNWIDVGIAVRSDLKLFENAIATLERPLLGNASALNIVQAGAAEGIATPQGNGPQLESGEQLMGQLAPNTFLATAGYGPDQANELQRFTKNAAEATEKLNSLIERANTDLPAIFADARESAKSVRERIPVWTGEVDQTLGSLKAGSEQFKALMTDGRAAAEDARKIIATAQDVIDRNSVKIDQAVTSIASAAEKVDRQSIAQFNDLMTSASSAVNRFTSTVNWFATWFSEEAPGLRKILANARLASDQLKLATIEIRQAPWKLLYSPKTKELETEVLQDATRTYAQAVSDLRAAGEALDSTIKNAPQPVDVEQIRVLRERLDAAFAGYEEAERALLKRMQSK